MELNRSVPWAIKQQQLCATFPQNDRAHLQLSCSAPHMIETRCVRVPLLLTKKDHMKSGGSTS
eukprot:3719119-Amphidinium_carterae.1